MQNIKSMIKKISAISTGAAMLGMSLTGALAQADLGNYPAPFVNTADKKFDYLGVVGDDAKSIDNLALTDIATSLSAVPVPGTSGGGTVTVAGGVTEDIPLGSNVAARNQVERSLTDSDISTLLDTTISFQGSDYDVSERLELGVNNLNNVSAETSLTATDDDYEDNVVMEVVSDAIKYYYAFDETIQINTTSSSDALDIKFLGKSLKITSIDSATKFTANVGSEYFVKIDDTIDVEGKTITLKEVGSGGNVLVDVDGTQESVSADTTKTVNGLEIKNDDTFYTDDKAERSAFLVVGKDATESYSDGDEYIGEDEDDPKWIWDLGNLNTKGTTTVSNSYTAQINASNSGSFIGIENDWNYRDGSDSDAIEQGSCIDLPNSYVSICLDSLTVADDNYFDLTLELVEGIDLTSDTKVPGLSNANVLHVKAQKDDQIKLIQSGSGLGNISADKETKELWLTDNGVYYHDKDLKKKTFAGNATSGVGFAQIQFDDTKSTNLVLNRTNTPTGQPPGTANITGWVLQLDAVGDSTDDLTAQRDTLYTSWTNSSGGVTQLGATKSSEEAGEVNWEGTNVGTKDENHRTRYGTIIKDPKSNGASDRVELSIPGDQVQVNVVVKPGTGATVVSGGSSGGAAISTYATAPDAMLDTEVTTPANHNLILIGGPAVNRLSAQFLGKTYPAYGADSGLQEGEAVLEIKDNGDNVALVVSGWTGDDTRRAAKVLQSYNAFSSQLSGTSVKVAGTASSPTIVTSA